MRSGAGIVSHKKEDGSAPVVPGGFGRGNPFCYIVLCGTIWDRKMPLIKE